MTQELRIDAEWALNAFRELLKFATKGDLAKSTYDDALGKVCKTPGRSA